MQEYELMRIPISETQRLLYAPVLGKIWKVRVDSDPGWITIQSSKDSTVVKPHLDMTFLISFRCNLSCVYCYEHHDGCSTLPFDTATKIAQSLLKRHIDVDRIVVNYFGGEPTLQGDFLRNFTPWIRNAVLGRSLRIGITTNGMIPRSVLKDIWNLVDRVKISFDGPRHIQDMHRRTLNGKSSFNRVVRTASELYEAHPDALSVRITITDSSVDAIPEICSFFCELLPGVRQQYEPVMDSCFADHSIATIEMHRFVNRFIEAVPIAVAHRTPIGTSFARFSRAGSDLNRFCGVASSKYTILPDGSLASCSRVHTTTVRQTPFFIAEPDAYNSFVRKPYSLPIACRDCFARYNCKGGCYAVRHSLGLGQEDAFSFCDEIRRLVTSILLFHLELKGGEML